jgi:hypothetical protein
VSSTPEPNAALIDAAALVAGLFLVRYVLLLVFPNRRWAGWIARWARRLVGAAAIVPALRLFTLPVVRGGDGAVMWFAGTGILAAGLALLVLDQMAAEALVIPAEQR